MFELSLFRIRAYTFGVLSSFLSALARGGLMFMLIIWLQGIWLPAARLQLRVHSALGRDLHAAADVRVPGRRARCRASSPTATARGRSRPAACSARRVGVRPARAAADRLLLRRLRRAPLPHGPLHGRVRGAQPRRRDEQPPAAAPRRRRRHEPDLPELGPGALDRHLLHADDHRALGDAPPRALLRPRGQRRRPPRPPPTSAASRRSRCSSPRSSATTRRSR